jgi:mRNA-degrading endonuclease RelE of RelBE toxin-antitoxin system
MWRLVVPRNVLRLLDKLPAHDRLRILEVINEIGTDPFGGNIKKIEGRYRRRSGNYRIFYEVAQNERIIEIQDVVRRTSTTY